VRADQGRHSFAGATSYYGVVGLEAFAEDTHDFEAHYIDGLVGPLPQAQRLYEERCPISNVDAIDRPLLLLQGDCDPTVPRAHTDMFVRALAEKRALYAYLTFPGEAHGFRMPETIAAALEAELGFYGWLFGFHSHGVPWLEPTRAKGPHPRGR
jgi:dipeptidyl aminopeptidase/acylaminoacyl peptidase